jgi:protein TonB
VFIGHGLVKEFVHAGVMGVLFGHARSGWGRTVVTTALLASLAAACAGSISRPPPPPLPLAVEAQKRAVDAYLLVIARKISEYFAGARHGHSPSGVQGVVTLRLTLTRQGDLTAAAIARSTGSDDLDAGILAAAHHSSPFPPFPPELQANTATVLIPLAFRKIN